MKPIFNKYIPFKGFKAINIFGFIFVRDHVKLTPRLLNHENIHSAQIRELGYVFFYIIYLLEWVVRLFGKGNAYHKISFEREAYENEGSLHYLSTRRHYAMWRKKA